MEGKLPKNWEYATLDDVAEYINGMAFKPRDWEESGRPIIRIQNLTNPKKEYNYTTKNVAEKYIIREQDILVSWSATLDVFIWRGPEAVLNQHIFKCVPKQEINKTFLYYLLKDSIRELISSEHLHGSTMQHVNRGPFLAHKIGLPPVKEQERIADRIDHLFSDLDEGEALLKTVQKQLATYRQSVLKAAVTGELTKDWREKNKKKLESGEKLLTRILESRRKNSKGRGKYEEPLGPDISLLPPLPNGWTWATLPQLGEFGRGKSKHRPRNDPKLYTDGKYPFLQTGAVRASRGRIKEYDTMYNDFGLKQSKLWPVGTVCITIAANIAESGILEIDACFPDSVVGLVPHFDIYGEYIEFFIRTARDNLERYAPATAQKNINLDILGKVGVPLPSTDEQKEVVDRVSQIFSQIDTFEALCEAELKRSNTLRQSILKSAFSGKLVAQDPADEPAGELLARIKSGDSPKTKTKVAAPRRGRKPRSDKTEAA